MNNKQINSDIKKIYKPETAFGNSEILKLLKQIRVPNDDGNFEIIGDSIVEIIGVRWECASCGNSNKDEILCEIEKVEAQCKKCKAKHLVEINNYI